MKNLIENDKDDAQDFTDYNAKKEKLEVIQKNSEFYHNEMTYYQTLSK